MISAEFFARKKSFCGFSVSGHADSVPDGDDIVCAAVSSAVYLVANAITDVLQADARVQVQQDGLLSLSVPPEERERCQPFFQALWLHLKQLAGQYPQNLRVLKTEE